MGKKNAILAVWTYHLPIIDPEIDAWLEHFYRVTLAGYWPERIRYLDQRYRTLPFPFDEIQPPAFEMEATWNANQLIGFLASWSAVKKLIEVRGVSAFEKSIGELEHIWEKKTKGYKLRWPLHLRIGKIS